MIVEEVKNLVLCGLFGTIPNESERLRRFRMLSENLMKFFQESEKVLIKAYMMYSKQFSVFPTATALVGKFLHDLGYDDTQVEGYIALLANFSGYSVIVSDFDRGVDVLRDMLLREKGLSICSRGEQILTSGLEIGKDRLSTVDSFISFMGSESMKLSSEMPQTAEEVLGNIDLTEDKIQGVRTGIDMIDDAISSMACGNLCLVGAYTGEGKSQFCDNVAHYNKVIAGKNVAHLSWEMQKKELVRRYIAEHSLYLNTDKAITKNALKSGVYDKEYYTEVSKDFFENPKYGKFSLYRMAYGDTIYDVEKVLAKSGIYYDLIILDYPAIMGSDRSGVRREELGHIIRGIKSFALNCQGGKGSVVLAPWQINRNGRKNAEKSGVYSLYDLEESADAEKNSDIILWLLRTNEFKAQHEVKFGIMKSRDSQGGQEGFLREDFDFGFLGMSWRQT